MKRYTQASRHKQESSQASMLLSCLCPWSHLYSCTTTSFCFEHRDTFFKNAGTPFFLNTKTLLRHASDNIRDRTTRWTPPRPQPGHHRGHSHGSVQATAGTQPRPPPGHNRGHTRDTTRATARATSRTQPGHHPGHSRDTT